METPPDPKGNPTRPPLKGGEREREGGSNCLSDGTTDAIEESGGKNATERNNEGLLKKGAGSPVHRRRKGERERGKGGRK